MLELKMTTDLQAAVPGEIGFNYDELKSELAERLEFYNNLVVTEDGIKEAKADRAKLNKLRAAIDARRKDIKKEYLKPYNDFESKIKELTLLIDKPIGAIDMQLATYEDRRKEEKRKAVEDLYHETISEANKDIISFERILDPKWLNATFPIPKIQLEMEVWNKRVDADMMVIDAVEPEFKISVKERYITTLDIASAIAHRDNLKAAQEAFKAKEAERIAREAERASDAKTEPQRHVLKIDTGEMRQIHVDAMAQDATPEPEVSPEPERPAARLHVLRLEFQMTRDQAIALRKFIDDNKISYRRII